MTDMVIMMGGIGHRRLADRAVCAVVIDAVKLFFIAFKLVRAEPHDVLSVMAEHRYQRIVGIEDQSGAVVDAVGDRVEYKFDRCASADRGKGW